jgi:predicted ester cyclase
MTDNELLKQAVRRATELHNVGDIEGFASCYADPCHFHFGRVDRHLSRAAHAEAVRSYFDVFPDFRGTIETLLADDSRAYVRWSYDGTHLGTSRTGIAPTGKHIEIGSILAEMRFEHGLIVEVWERMSFVDLKDLTAPF